VLPKIYSIKYYQPVEKTKERFPHLIIWPSLFCLVLGFAAGRFSRRDTRPILPVIPSTLFSPDEKKIIDLLRTDNEKMNQKEIARRLEWSKSKVSAVITNLEYKKVVRREKLGRSFKVELLSDMVDMEDKDQV